MRRDFCFLPLFLSSQFPQPKKISNSGGSHGDLGMRNSDSWVQLEFEKKKLNNNSTIGSLIFLFSAVRRCRAHP